MLTRLSHVLLSFLTNRFEGVVSATIFAVAQEIMKKGRQTLFLIFASFVLSVLFAAGVIISLLEASAQYDSRGVIYFTALLTCSLSMTAISAVAMAIIFWPRSPGLTEAQAHTTAPSQNPLEEILTAAITEGVEYIKQRQATKTRRPNEYSQA